MKRLIARALKHPRTCAAALAGFVLAVSVTGMAWRAYDRLLAAEAEQQALAGQSEAVAATRPDWAATVGPVALLASGRPGSEARRVATARIDLAIRRSDQGDPDRLFSEGVQLLRLIRTTDGVPTESGARWARWLAERLAAASGQLSTKDKLRLLTETDATLAALAASAQRPAPTTAGSEAAQPRPPILLDTASPPIAASPAAEDGTVEPAPLPFEETTELIVRRAPPSDWQPSWQDKGTPSIDEMDSDVPPQEPTTPAAPLPAAAISDRDLLAEFVRRMARHGPVPMATGPTSIAPDTDVEDDPSLRRLLEVRAELARRGFRAVTVDQVALLLSTDPTERLTLVNQLLSVPSTNAVRMLLLLASDERADVRAAAISGLGSSSSRELVQLAWELATRDDDYRVGRLADGLRQRLR